MITLWPALVIVPVMVLTGHLPWPEIFQFLLMLLAFGFVWIMGGTFMSVVEAYELLEKMRLELAERDWGTLSEAQRAH